MIGQRAVNDIPALTLATDELEAAFVTSAGMVGCSLRHRGEELLGQRGGLRAYVEGRATMGIPLLHPWANRLGRTRFPVAGSEVDLEATTMVERDPNGLPMHGMLNAAHGWRVEDHKATDRGGALRSSFDFASHPQLIAAFPFPHEIQFEARLRDRTLAVEIAVLATGDAPVPISFGFHPYLRLPDVPRPEWEVEIPVTERLELDDRMLPTGHRSPARVDAGALSARSFDDAFVAPPGESPFALAGGGRRIELRLARGYGFAQVYAPLDDDVIAYEPMTAPTNALLDGGPDLPLLEPGERYEAVFSITVIEG